MYDWLVDHKIPLGSWVKTFVDLLNDHAQVVFDFISLVVGAWIEGLTSVLIAVPPLLLIAAIAGLAYVLHRSIGLAVFALLALLLVVNLGYWQATLETLSLVICSTLVCVIVGLPLGIASAHRPWLYATLRPILDLMQTIPTFVYLIPTLVLFGLGTVPGLISTVIFALPARDSPDLSRDLVGAGPALGGRKGLRGHEDPAPVQGRAAARASDDHGRRHPVHHAQPVHGRHRRPRRCRRPREAGRAGPEHSQHHPWASRPGPPSSCSRSSSIASARHPTVPGGGADPWQPSSSAR